MKYWVFDYSTTPTFRSFVKDNPSAGGGGVVAGGEEWRLLRCDSGEHVVLSALDEQKDIALVFSLL
jgi:hypothetical protein